ncbi:MAG: T9SS type A sorting domain-containing protein [Bacteroidetes bacterium]|nr:T9SS type A sorting domain-containing protein [Bacteroidota bacterium]
MKKILLVVLLYFISVQSSTAQYLSSFQLVTTYNFTQIDSIYFANNIPSFIFPKRFNVNVYKIIYNTVSYDSTATIASGALLLPVNPPCKLPLISDQHGTETVSTNVPSNLGGELPVRVTMASDGDAAPLPDYLGLGDSPLPIHPYLHSQSEATATIDMLRAARELIDSLGFELNGQLFLAGYSQGGHATMAAQKMMEEQFPQEFPITASLPMSGPYDLSGSQARVIEVDSVFSASVYLPYIVFSYDEVYNLWANDSSVFISPYDTSLRPLFNGLNNLLTINSQLPSIPNDILQPLLLDSFINDSNHYVRQALRDNDLTDWTPVSPTKMMYCTADEQVVYQNSIVAYNKFIQNGSTSVQLVNSGALLGHSMCAGVSFINGKAWFDTLRTDYIISDVTIVDESFSGALDGQIGVNILGGVPPYTISWSNGATSTLNTGLATGTYILTVTDSVGCTRMDTLQVGLTTNLISINSGTRVLNYHPNPVSDQLVITSTTNYSGAIKIAIMDIQGRLIYVASLDDKIIVDCKPFSKGIYFIHAMGTNGPISNGKFIIE